MHEALGTPELGPSPDIVDLYGRWVEGGDGQFFAPPRELSREEIGDIVRRFVTTARIAKKAGFTGVEIHAAHGYLISQFLSPVDNRRTDEYGGSLQGRMRFLVEVYQGMRETLGPDFPIAVKLNSSDGDPGGMTQEESLLIAARLSELGVDVLEVSDGTTASRSSRRPIAARRTTVAASTSPTTLAVSRSSSPCRWRLPADSARHRTWRRAWPRD